MTLPGSPPGRVKTVNREKEAGPSPIDGTAGGTIHRHNYRPFFTAQIVIDCRGLKISVGFHTGPTRHHTHDASVCCYLHLSSHPKFAPSPHQPIISLLSFQTTLLPQNHGAAVSYSCFQRQNSSISHILNASLTAAPRLHPGLVVGRDWFHTWRQTPAKYSQ